MTFTLENFELFFLILVRISAFIYTAPFFSLRNVPIRVKTGFSIFFALILFYMIPFDMPVYEGIIDFSLIVIKEAIAGAIMGMFANIAYYILAFAGRIMDMQIGFSMVNELDPVSMTQTTITANLYGYLVLLMMVITNLHHHFIKGIVDSFKVIRIGDVSVNPNIYTVFVQFVVDYFIIGFRIVLPIFTAILIVNTILAILAKIAPQMNMFVIGMQLKVLVGLIVLSLIIVLIPSVSDVIFNKMMEMFKLSIKWLS